MAKAHVDDGVPVQEVMRRFDIPGASSVKRWSRLYREGGAEALKPGRRGRPRGCATGPSRSRRVCNDCRRRTSFCARSLRSWRRFGICVPRGLVVRATRSGESGAPMGRSICRRGLFRGLWGRFRGVPE
ncbi:helix-turn-helix domain-containing protein [Pseudoscardovia radai]|uniref:helix-turn-helix domain-containing protein n=1 Tax=Pseudoscardovia radai TaxID=987066 RepID=UPI00130307C2